ncbi:MULTISPECIES: DUF2252 domain-containing protein [Arthrobacter]|uniref:DUF2252 domain-containing protein n=2 Tax=Arthrobacter TaxID=1663 RepID=A0ABU9KQ72_9MICC|nr:DUF2252 domain-containing protein [Arthrobacter sp. YJM1]MDP5227832.1 DUF2252 domain-containing protein [Arthrobacter sp. YJM1]
MATQNLTLHEQLTAGRSARAEHPRKDLARLTTGDRDPLGILTEQNATRVQELIPLRQERMAASAFAFYRGAAAVMAADLARDPNSRIGVGSCGDAHLANFGFYASPERSLVFDLNDFDEAAWAPWEWDVKRLMTSFVVAGRQDGRAPKVIERAALAIVESYRRGLKDGLRLSPVQRFYTNVNAEQILDRLEGHSRRALEEALTKARRRTSGQAARKLTAPGPDGRARFVDAPPVMERVDAVTAHDFEELYRAYQRSAAIDIAFLVGHYSISDFARRVVGVGSVGTQCFVIALEEAGGDILILQAKEARESVLAQYGGIPQPKPMLDGIAGFGEGARVVGMQKILQACSDPFLGHLKTPLGDFYLRQFRDMKGGIDVSTLEDESFHGYAQACAVLLARSHSQSPAAARVSGYLGGGKRAGTALVDWAQAYADLNARDHEAFVTSLEDRTPQNRDVPREESVTA